jgi:hypothetical protein
LGLASLAISLATTPIANALLAHGEALRDFCIGRTILVKLVESPALIGSCLYTHGTPPVLLTKRMPQNGAESNLTKG